MNSINNADPLMENYLWTGPASLPPHYNDHNQEAPGYSSSVSLVGRFLCKQELEIPGHPATCRSWSRVQAELRGTLLIIRSYRPISTPIIKSYTLQAADAGLATDYYRRSHVLRIRAEGHQFLLAAANLFTVIDWVDKLNAAIAISLPLDYRGEARYRTLPTPSKFALSSASFRDRVWRSVREEWCLSQQKHLWLRELKQYPEDQQPCLSLPNGSRELVASTNTARVSSRRRKSYNVDRLSSSASCPCSHCWARGESLPAYLTTVTTLTPLFAKSLYTVEDDASTSSQSSISGGVANGKWSPKPYVSTAQAKLDYARRCARVLTYGAPWKGWYFIREGQAVGIPHLPTVPTGGEATRQGC